MDGETRRHRALAEPSRRRLLDALYSTAAPLAVGELADDLELHPNTIRAHLDVLVDAELVVVTRETDGRPGRPRLLFAALPAEAEEEHALLAAALASSLEPLADGPELAAVAGRSWGRVLVERLEPGEPPTAANTLAHVATLLRRRGFAPGEPTEREIVMHHCPFRALAERYPRVVCGLHAGILEGALEELDAPLEIERLEPWTTSTTCTASLQPRR
jgi:predicted ArsR family transcriptional regulator